MKREEVIDIVEDVWWQRLKIVLAAGSLLVAVWEFMKGFDDNGVKPCETKD